MSRIVKSDRIVINADKKFSSNSVGLNSVGGRARSHADDESVDANYSGLIKAARRQAEGIIKSARDNAERITREAQISATEVMETARKEGHTDGYADGYDKGYAKGVSEGQDHGMAQYRDIIQKAMELKQNYLDDYENLYRASERHMLGLSIEIARKVIGGVLENDDRACVELAYNALKQMRGNGKASLRV
ncbi:MAG TPA: hypothetical protein VFD89_03755, partial [Clostridia bacterium]|nr:hypothetical protein [Clostridia bacterium]